jgi:hypothetical protein
MKEQLINRRYVEMSKAQEIKTKLEDAGISYWAGDNISEVLQKGDKEQLIDEATLAFKVY